MCIWASTAAVLLSLGSPTNASDNPDITASDRRPNTVAGRVLDDKRQSIAGAEVTRFRVNQLAWTRKLIDQQLTDVNGNFRFKNVVDAKAEFPDSIIAMDRSSTQDFVEVYVRKTGYVADSWIEMLPQIVKTGAFQKSVLSASGRLTGRVTNLDGRPVSGAIVSVDSPPLPPWLGTKSTRTNNDGTYEIADAVRADYLSRQNEKSIGCFPGIRERDHRLTVEHPNFAIKEVVIRSFADANLQLEPAAIVEGRIEYADVSQQAGDAIILICSSPSPVRESNLRSAIPIGRIAKVDKVGHYRFTNLPQGQYDLLAQPPGWTDVRLDKIDAIANQTTTAPNLIVKGELVVIRLVAEATGQAVEIRPDTRAIICGRTLAPNRDGRFEFHMPVGAQSVMVSDVYEGVEHRWAGPWVFTNGPEPPMVNVKEAETTTADVPVVARHVNIANRAPGE